MNKGLLCVFICCTGLLLSGVATAQIIKPGIMLGGSVMYSRPHGSFGNAYNFGGGAEAFAGVGWGSTYLIGTAGFSAFSAGSKTAGTLTFVPLKIGVRQFFLKKRLFINGDLGLASVKNKIVNDGLFTRGIGAGVRLLGLELALYYDGFKNKSGGGFSNFADFKAGWTISL